MILQILGIIQGIEIGIIQMYILLISSGHAVSGSWAFLGVAVAAFPFCLSYGVIAGVMVTYYVQLEMK